MVCQTVIYMHMANRLLMIDGHVQSSPATTPIILCLDCSVSALLIDSFGTTPQEVVSLLRVAIGLRVNKHKY